MNKQVVIFLDWQVSLFITIEVLNTLTGFVDTGKEVKVKAPGV
jgi:hypothetical protein